MKICVPSKNRAGLVETHKVFNKADVIVFVEPQQYDDYVSAHPDLTFVNIGATDQGIGYVRNFILDYIGDQNFIIADDDIIALTKRSHIPKPGGSAKFDVLSSPDEVLEYMEEMLDDHAMVGFVQEAYAHFSEPGHTVNKGYPIQFVAISGEAIGRIRYDRNLWAMEDADFAIQLIENGQQIVVSADYCYKQNGKLESNFYKDDTGNRNALSSKAAEELYEKYDKLGKSHYVTLVHRKKPEHRQRKYIRVNYNKIAI